MSQKAASLGGGLIAKKGAAMPAVPLTEAVMTATVAPVRVAAVKAYDKALTVKLDRARYERLKQLGLRLDQSSQEIFVAALDRYLEQSGA